MSTSAPCSCAGYVLPMRDSTIEQSHLLGSMLDRRESA